VSRDFSGESFGLESCGRRLNQVWWSKRKLATLRVFEASSWRLLSWKGGRSRRQKITGLGSMEFKIKEEKPLEKRLRFLRRLFLGNNRGTMHRAHSRFRRNWEGSI